MEADAVARLRATIGRLSRQLNASSTTEGLTPSQASALGVVAHRGPVSLAYLARFEGLNPTMVSRIVGNLARQKLIRRRAHPQDQRAAMVEITALGAETSVRIQRQRDWALADCLGRLTDHERAAIVSALPALESLALQLMDTRRDGESTGVADLV